MMVRSDWLEESIQQLVEWRCARTMYGALCATWAGMIRMQRLLAGVLDSTGVSLGLWKLKESREPAYKELIGYMLWFMSQ